MIIIRECRMEDASAIQKFNSEEMGYDYPLEDTKRSLEKLLGRKSDKIFVAVQDGTVVGYAHANDYDLLYMPHMKNIMGIAVASARRRQGIGKLLLTAVEEWAKATGAVGVRLVSGAARSILKRYSNDRSTVPWHGIWKKQFLIIKSRARPAIKVLR